VRAAADSSSADVERVLGEGSAVEAVRVVGAVKVLGTVATNGPDTVAIGTVRLAVLSFVIRMRSSCGGMRVRGASGYSASPPMDDLGVFLTSSRLKCREFRGCRQDIGGRKLRA
jgi:hypothetical protein